MNQQSHPWERQQGETDKAWEAFVVFRDMGGNRSVAATIRALGRPKGYRRFVDGCWVRKYNWKQRCLQYDNHVDRIQRIQIEEIRRERYLARLALH